MVLCNAYVHIFPDTMMLSDTMNEDSDGTEEIFVGVFHCWSGVKTNKDQVTGREGK